MTQPRLSHETLLGDLFRANKGRLIVRDEIAAELWPEGYRRSGGAINHQINVYLNRLRDLGARILTEKGHGYIYRGGLDRD